ncbi:MAG: adenylate/guanylate cyclase domain-containing protein [Candidatus Hydrothermia bacterium]
MIKPERRKVAVLFADIKGFTTLSEFLDPEDLQELVDTIFRDFRYIIESNGGYLDKIIGDAIMAVFGVPSSKGDDTRRAVLTALQMQDTLRRINEEKKIDIKLRIGINYGEVLWSSIAGEKPTVIGDTVNVAQRVEELVEPGRVFVTESIYQLEYRNFYFVEVGLFKLRGRDEPVKVFEVLSEKIHVNEFSIRGRFVTPFTGRVLEMEDLLSWFKFIMENPKIYSLILWGEAGIGKTRFSSEFNNVINDNFKDLKTFLVKCDPVKQRPFYVLKALMGFLLEEMFGKEYALPKVIDVFVNDFGILEVEAEILARRIELFLKGELTLTQSDILLEFISQIKVILENFARNRRGVVIFIDDSQYADSETLEFFSRLKKEEFDTLILLFFSSREKLMFLDFDKEIQLSGLGEDFIREVCVTILGVEKENISRDFISWIEAKTRGNPYFVEELVYYLKTKDLLDLNPLRLKSEDVSVPESVSGVLLSLVDELQEDVREVIKTASVVGKNFWKNFLERILRRSIEYELSILVKEGLIVPQIQSYLKDDEEYTFRNDLLRESVYSLLTKKEKENLHKIVAEELERITEKDEHLLYLTACNFDKAANREKAHYYYELAGDKAFLKGYYSYALKAYEAIEPNEEIFYKIAQCLEGLGEFEKSKEIILCNLERLEENSLLRTKFEILLSGILEKEHKFQEAFNFLERASNSEDPDLRAYAIYKKAWVYFRMGDYEKAMEFAHASMKIIEDFGLSSRDAIKTLGACFTLLGIINQSKGDEKNLMDALEYYEKARILFEEIGEVISQAKILINISQILLALQKYTEAESYLQESFEVVKKSGSRFLMAVVLNNLGRVYYNSRKHVEKAREYYHEAYNIFRSLNLQDYCIDTGFNLAGFLIEQGEYDKAQEILDNISKNAHELNQYRRGLFYILGALLFFRSGLYDQALSYFEKAQSIYESLSSKDRIFQVKTYLGAIAYLRGDEGSAISYVLDALNFLTEADVKIPRVVDSLIVNGLVQFLCRRKIEFPEFVDIEAFREEVRYHAMDIKLSWTVLLKFTKNKGISELGDLFTREQLKDLHVSQNFPFFEEAQDLSGFLKLLDSWNAVLLKKLILAINRLT